MLLYQNTSLLLVNRITMLKYELRVRMNAKTILTGSLCGSKCFHWCTKAWAHCSHHHAAVMFVLRQKPKFPVPCDAEDAFRAVPKPPADPLEVKRGLAGARARLLRAGSLTALPPIEGHTDGKSGGKNTGASLDRWRNHNRLSNEKLKSV